MGVCKDEGGECVRMMGEREFERMKGEEVEDKGWGEQAPGELFS